jgi:cystathionine beta-lyase/cystathionine gamma-synthase
MFLLLIYVCKLVVFHVFIVLFNVVISCSQIARVYYPGLPSHPEHHIAKSQMTGFGGVVSFEVNLILELIVLCTKLLRT